MYSNANAVNFIRQTHQQQFEENAEKIPIKQQYNNNSNDSTAATTTTTRQRPNEHNSAANYTLDQFKVLCSIAESTTPPCYAENNTTNNDNIGSSADILNCFNLNNENNKCKNNNNNNNNKTALPTVVSGDYNICTKGASILIEIIANEQINDNSHQQRSNLLTIN